MYAKSIFLLFICCFVNFFDISADEAISYDKPLEEARDVILRMIDFEVMDHYLLKITI